MTILNLFKDSVCMIQGLRGFNLCRGSTQIRTLTINPNRINNIYSVCSKEAIYNELINIKNMLEENKVYLLSIIVENYQNRITILKYTLIDKNLNINTLIEIIISNINEYQFGYNIKVDDLLIFRIK